jgi:hypothetical protein
MAHTHNQSRFLMFYPETTVCAPPADWASSGTRVEFVALEVSPKQELLTDPTMEGNPLAVGKRLKIKGRRNVEWSATFKVHGIGATTEDGNQAPETYLSKILKWCLGGAHRSNTTSITGGTATEPVLDDVTNYIPGCMAGFIDTTSPDDGDAGKVHFRRVLEVDGVTKTLTLSEALPFTPASGDLCPATITLYVDRSVLVDAVAGPTTWNWLARIDESGTDMLTQLEGSVGSLALQGLNPGELPQAVVNVMSANFSTTDDDGLSAVTFPEASGTSAQLVNGVDIQASIGVYGNTDEVPVEFNNVAFETGLARSKVETTTERIHRFEGLATFCYNVSETKFNATVVPFSKAYYEGLNDSTEFRINYYQPGPGNGAGKAWGLHIARAQVAATPSRVDVGDANGVAVEFSAMIPNDCTGGSNAHLERSPFLLAIA